MNKSIVFMIICVFFVNGCAGRTAHPVQIHQPGDDTRSVASINAELQEIDRRVHELVPRSSKTGRNVALGVGGLLFFPAWFFMDLKNAEKVELKSLEARYAYLTKLKEQKLSNGPTK